MTKISTTIPLSMMTERQHLIMLLESFLEENYTFRRNVVSDMLEFRRLDDETMTTFRPLTPEAFNGIVTNAMKSGIDGNIRQLLDQLINNDEVEEYHPARAYLENLPEWDGKDRVKPLFQRIPGITDEQIGFASRWQQSCVAHWMGVDNTYGNQTVLLLTGSQGQKKSTFLKKLLPKHLQNYYLDHLNLSNKNDKEMALSNNLIVNIDEIDQISQSQQASLKYVITKADVNGRKIFGRTQRNRPRVASFSATTNSPHPLKDPTGSRRFLCIKVEDGKEIDLTEEIEYEQLYAQLYHEVVEEKQRYWLTDEENKRMEQLNQRFYDCADLEQIVNNCFRVPETEEIGSNLTSGQILEVISREYPGIQNNRSMQTRLGATLTALGYKRHHCEKGNVYSIINKVA